MKLTFESKYRNISIEINDSDDLPVIGDMVDDLIRPMLFALGFQAKTVNEYVPSSDWDWGTNEDMI